MTDGEKPWRPRARKLHAEGTDIIQVQPDDGALVDAVVELQDAVDAVDCPWHNGLTSRSLRAWLTHGWDGEPMQWYAGMLDGQVVAAAELWVPLRDNRNSAWFGVGVDPRRRRQGLGGQLVDHLEELATTAGRTVLGVWGWESVATTAFAAHRRPRAQVRRGMPAGHLGRRSRASWWTRHTRKLARPLTDYDLVRIAGPLTDEQIEDCLPVVASINDAPTDELVIEDEVFTAERVRAYDEAQLAWGARMYRVWARHRDTGEVAGHTVVAVDEDRPHLGDQHDTTVLPKHRGHRLGLLLKADMMRWLRDVEPNLATITTDNAESNAHMIAVNERLGYRVMARTMEFQRVVG